MKSEEIKSIIMQIARADIKKILNYQALIFNFYFMLVKKSNKFNEDELKTIREAFKLCTESNVKIESISRQRRVLTGKTRGVKGALYNDVNYKKSLNKESEILLELGY